MMKIPNAGAASAASSGAKTKLTALFDSRSDAERAFQRLKNVEISEVRLIPGHDADGAELTPDRQGLWGKLEDWLSDDDRAAYAEGLSRGGYFVSVEVGSDNYDTAYEILDAEGSIDLEERTNVWRAEGWDAQSSSRELNTKRVSSVQATEEKIRLQQYAGERGDVFAVEETSKRGERYKRREDASSRRVRSYDLLTSEFADDPHLRDDILPTGHHLSAEEGGDDERREVDQSHQRDGLQEDHNLDKGR